MKLIIAGSRGISLSVEEIDKLVKENFEDHKEITELVSGCAIGMDTSGINWAIENKITIKKFIPDWTIGKSAGHVRNRQMGDYADQALVVYNGSAGSQGMIDYMNKLGKKCVVILKKE